MSRQCVLLNADYTFLNFISWKRAFRLVSKDKVEVLQYANGGISCGKFSWRMPAVMRLIKLIRVIYRNRVPFTKRNIMIRDNFRCVYCGSNSDLTLDHVLPASRGGKTTFDNCVTACRSCNNKKGNRTPNESNMFMKKRPYQPTISEFLMIKLKQSGVDKILREFGIY